MARYHEDQPGSLIAEQERLWRPWRAGRSKQNPVPCRTDEATLGGN